MNVKKLGDDELRSLIIDLGNDKAEGCLNAAGIEFLRACEKELARRWGIKL